MWIVVAVALVLMPDGSIKQMYLEPGTSYEFVEACMANRAQDTALFSEFFRLGKVPVPTQYLGGKFILPLTVKCDFQAIAFAALSPANTGG